MKAMDIDHIPLSSSIREELKVVLNSGNIPHASLFAGQDGGAQLAAAFAVAKSLLCIQAREGLSCGECQACNKCQKLIHPDLSFSFPVTSTIGTSEDCFDKWRDLMLTNLYSNLSDWIEAIDAGNAYLNISAREIRRIEGLLSRKSFEGRAKVLIIWYPEFLGVEGNKLLKSIEEPPPNTYIFLVATNSVKILPTILSRCRLFNIPRVPPKMLAKWLEEYKRVLPHSALTAAAISEGIVNEALKSLEGDYNADVAGDFIQWSRTSFTSDPIQIIDFVELFLKDGGKEKCRNLFRYGLFYFNQVNRILNGLIVENLSGKVHGSAQKMAGFLDLNSIESLCRFFDRLIIQIDRNASLKILLTHATIQLGRRLRIALKRSRSSTASS
ncbi:MAG: hypothetical protein EA409_04575 [Saprospirales bacterium]|nr:MAG: hypothetical protein EA409_04575 [Saprospirales bacterium]